jgi:hypothetical protein
MSGDGGRSLITLTVPLDPTDADERRDTGGGGLPACCA